MYKLQDEVINAVQDYLKKELDGIITDFNIERINEDIEVKILAVFYDNGITSNPKIKRHD
jgi:hypothetical protein